MASERKCTVAILFPATLLALLWTSHVSCEVNSPRLVVAATSPRTTILCCEPLMLDIEIANQGDASVDVEEPMTLGHPFEVHVTPPDGQRFRYTSPWSGSHSIRKVTIDPGAVYRARMTLLYGGLRSAHQHRQFLHIFSTPGDYVVEVAYWPHRPKGPRLEAAALHVEVVEPHGRQGEALQLFRGQKQIEFMAIGRGKTPPEQLVRLKTQYPDTVYGRYARFYLAAALLEHRFDWQEARRTFAAELAGLDRLKAERRLFEKVFEKTAAEFADLAGAKPAFPLADQCLLYEAQCYTGSPANRKAEAVKVLRDLVERYPKSPAAVKARKRLEKLGTKPPAPTTTPPAP